MFWTVANIWLARRNHVPILDPDTRYFRSVVGQASLVVFLLVSASHLVSLVLLLLYIMLFVLIDAACLLRHSRDLDNGRLHRWLLYMGLGVVQRTRTVSIPSAFSRFHGSRYHIPGCDAIPLCANSFRGRTKITLGI